jgi:hypothetical protein
VCPRLNPLRPHASLPPPSRKGHAAIRLVTTAPVYPSASVSVLFLNSRTYSSLGARDQSVCPCSAAGRQLRCCMVTWLYGYMVIWVHCYMAICLHGYMVI